MTTVPQPADPTQSFTATYDAWNRLVKLVDGANTVAEYAYDGAKRRVIQKSYTGGTLDETRHLYYTEPSLWQVIEERLNTDTDPNRQFVWGLRYIDDLVLRDRDTTGNGTLDERLYAMQDANGNVTAICDTSGTVQERYAYSAYGTPLFLTASFGSSTPGYDWETLYRGYRWNASSTLQQIRNREYSATIGVWMQRDSLGLIAGSNLYEYVTSRPQYATDPMGLISIPTAVCSFAGDDATGCVCSFIGVIDATIGMALPPFSPVGMLLDALDCACEFLDVLAVACKGCSPVTIPQLISEAGTLAIGCTMDMLSLGGLDIQNAVELILEAYDQAVGIVAGPAGGVPPGFAQCLLSLEEHMPGGSPDPPWGWGRPDYPHPNY